MFYYTTHDLTETAVSFKYYVINYFPFKVEYNGREYVCRPCWQRAQRAVQPNNNPAPHECVLQVEEYSRVPSTSANCMFDRCRSVSRRRMPENVRITLMLHSNLFIPDSARICDAHLTSNDWEELIDSPNLRHDFNSSHFVQILELFKKAVLNKNILDFEDIANMDPNEIHIRLGVSRDQFNTILEQTPSLSESNAKTKLAIYLMKLRTGDSNERLATLFNISRRTLERHLKTARDAISLDFKPRHLGLDHLNRRMVADRNLIVPNALFGNPESSPEERKAVTIMDGTYIYIQKSSNFSFQRRTYSLHKYENLLKPFLMVCSDGHIIDVCGPYAATDSDASILERIINDEEGTFHWFYGAGDIFILDRGFRDVCGDLERCNYSAYMPETKDRGADQLTTEQANRTRLVTLCRWVVEVINGRFKRDFKLFRQEYFNRALSHMFEDFQNAAALINAFQTPIQDSIHASSFVNIINERFEIPNLLADYVIRHNINRQRASFERLSSDQPIFEDFPVFSEEDLILFALGTYQIKLARSYYAEHLIEGLYNIEVYRERQISQLRDFIEEEDIWLLRVRIQSRHVRSRIYYSYIVINRQRQNREAIAHYYCSCLSGRRTIGCCAHVMCVVWYLAWARHQDEDILLPASELSAIIVH